MSRPIEPDSRARTVFPIVHDSFDEGLRPTYGSINEGPAPDKPTALFQPPPLRHQPKLPIVILMIVEFLDTLITSIVIPSQFEFIASIEGVRSTTFPSDTFFLTLFCRISISKWSTKDTRATLWSGIAIALNSAATFLFSPICGAWTDRRSCREVLLVTTVLTLIGNSLYGFSTTLWMLLLSRVIVGFGAGNQVVSQVYFTWSTTPQQRSLV